ncbi:MAG: penicillin-binding protein 2 [Anaerolineae bacterium]|nr:penicillin-binding protein 2 [Anaerolineae bacterium]
MKFRIWIAILSALLLASCTGTPSPMTPATTPLTPSPSPTPTPVALPTVNDVAATELLGRTFLTAWEENEYAQMYNLLTPALRAGLSQTDFEKAYRTPLDITTVNSVTLTPQTLNVDGARAWIDFEEVWHTGLFGDLSSANRLNLVKENGAWWVDWQRATVWPDLIGGNTFAVEYQIPPRANIYDRQGVGLAIPVTIVTVGIIPEQMTDETAVLEALATVLNMTAEEIQAEYAGQPSNWYIPIGDITGDESLMYDSQLSLPGIERRDRTGRLYPLDGVGAHVIGWTSPIPEESYQDYRRRGYRGDERVGISGLEAWGESILAGRNGGRLYIVAQDGTYVKGLAERQPQHGRSIYTTLDRNLQAATEQVLGFRRGAVVAIDVRSGAILALASGPRFDNNIFIRPSDEAARQQALTNPDIPLLNRALQGTYPTGSVFKIITLSAALEAGRLDPQTTFYCPGYWDGLGEPNRKFCWAKEGHGNIALQDALSASCNVTFYEVARMLYNADENILTTYGYAFGLGQETGLEELPESGGLMPGPEWKMNTYNQPWALGDAVNLGIGQGYLLATPLQVARMVAAVANGGTLYRPYLVDHITASSEIPEQMTQPKAIGQLPISKENLAIVQEAMHNTTTQSFGTATHRFSGLGISVAGKTGTAEAASKTDVPHSWFVGYFPFENPQIAMVVIVENAGEGSSVAAPMFRQIMEIYYNLPITPLPVITTPEGD